MISALLLPAGHSPGIEPEAVFVLAEMMASGRVQKPSLAITGKVLLTVIVVVGVVGAAKLKYVSRTATEKNAPAVIVWRLKIPDWEVGFFFMGDFFVWRLVGLWGWMRMGFAAESLG